MPFLVMMEGIRESVTAIVRDNLIKTVMLLCLCYRIMKIYAILSYPRKTVYPTSFALNHESILTVMVLVISFNVLTLDRRSSKTDE